MYKILPLLFLLFGQSYALNRGEIRDMVRKDINDSGPTTAEYYWTDDELNDRINLVQDQIASFTRAIEGRWTSSTTAEQREYTISTQTLVITRVSYSIISSTNTDSGVYKRLTAITLGGLDSNVSSEWENADSGLPTRYYIRAGKIGLYPVPSAVYASTHPVLRVDFIKKPDELTSDTDIPFDGMDYLKTYHYLIAKGVAVMCIGKGSEEYYVLLEKMRNDLLWKPDAYIGEPYKR